MLGRWENRQLNEDNELAYMKDGLSCQAPHNHKAARLAAGEIISKTSGLMLLNANIQARKVTSANK